MKKNNKNATTVPIFDKQYPKYIKIPEDYWTFSPDNVTYIKVCNKCKKEHKV